MWLCDFSLCDYVFLSNFPSSYKDTDHIRLKATQIQYTPTKILFSSKATFIGSG